LAHDLDAIEQEQERKYLCALGVADSWIPVLIVMFLVHHLGCRLELAASDRKRQEQVCGAMRECALMLEGRPSNAASPCTAN